MSTSATSNAIMEAGGKDQVTYLEVLATDDHPGHPAETKLETYSTVSEHTKKRINAEAKAVHHHITMLRKTSYALSWKPCQGGSSKLNLPDHRYKRRCCSLIPAESDSLPHAHAQTTKTHYKHQDSRIKKAQ
ncbi:hypothetical protein Tco_0579019 [Tanacetum coccineum]